MLVFQLNRVDKAQDILLLLFAQTL